MSEQDKQAVEARIMQTYDSLIDEDPEVQERVARGKIEALQEMVLEAVKSQYPSLGELAQERVGLIREPATLRQLVIYIFTAPDENTVRFLLTHTAADV